MGNRAPAAGGGGGIGGGGGGARTESTTSRLLTTQTGQDALTRTMGDAMGITVPRAIEETDSGVLAHSRAVREASNLFFRAGMPNARITHTVTRTGNAQEFESTLEGTSGGRPVSVRVVSQGRRGAVDNTDVTALRGGRVMPRVSRTNQGARLLPPDRFGERVRDQVNTFFNREGVKTTEPASSKPLRRRKG